MKQATCRDLRGACDVVFAAETPEQMGELGKAHVMEMVTAQEPEHTAAMQSMMALSSEEQHGWYAEFIANFGALPEA